MMQIFPSIVQHRFFGFAWSGSKKHKIDNTWSGPEKVDICDYVADSDSQTVCCGSRPVITQPGDILKDVKTEFRQMI